MVLTPAALWLNTVFAAFDVNVALFIHRLYDLCGGFFTPFFDFVSLLGKGGVFLILIGFILVAKKSTRRMGTAMLLGLAVGFILTNCVFKIIVARPRPYIEENSVFYQIWLAVGQRMEHDKSFPSGHTNAAMAAATAVFLTGNKRYSWTAFLFALLMGIARIYLCVHFPSDVLGGFAVGFISGCVAVLIAYKLPRKWYELDFFKKGEA